MWSCLEKCRWVIPLAALGFFLTACPAKQPPSPPVPPSPATDSATPPAPSVPPTEPSSTKPEKPAEPQGESSSAKKQDQATDQGDDAAGEKSDAGEEGSRSASTTGEVSGAKSKSSAAAAAAAAKPGTASAQNGREGPEGAQAGSPPAGAQTAGEHSAELEGKLAGSLREFDAMLLKEQEELQRRRSESGGELDPVGTLPGGGRGAGAASSLGESANGGPGSGSTTPGSSGATPAAGIGAVPVPQGVPDGTDDDVVARQMREAALHEKDPALRVRLWKEYCDYKKSTGGKQCTLPAGETVKPGNGGNDGEE